MAGSLNDGQEKQKGHKKAELFYRWRGQERDDIAGRVFRTISSNLYGICHKGIVCRMKTNIRSGITFKHRAPSAVLVRDKTDWLMRQCADKRVLHVGCVDAGLTEEKRNKNTLLHGKLAGVCANLIGIDIDKNGIVYMEKQGFKNIFVIDLSVSSTEVIDKVVDIMGGCDVVLCGEVLEHVHNIGRFLTGVHAVARAFGSEVVITGPNAHNFFGMLMAIAGIERVHPDHKCYFSWKTMDTLLCQSGFEVEELLFYTSQLPITFIKRYLKAFIYRTLFFWRPQLSEGLILKVKAI